MYFLQQTIQKKRGKTSAIYGNVGKAQEESPVKEQTHVFILFTNNYTSIALVIQIQHYFDLILLNKWPEKKTWAKGVRAMEVSGAGGRRR